MAKLIFLRILQGIMVLLIVSFLIFRLLATVGGDALTALQNYPQMSEKTMEQLRHIYGLDKPFLERYASWVGEAARGNLGQSIYFQEPVWRVIVPRLMRTGMLALFALMLALIISLTLGLMAARWVGSWIDRLSQTIELLGSSTPRLLLSLLALAVVVRVTWLGIESPGLELSGFEWALRLAPPTLVLSTPLIALFLTQTRVSMSMALNQDFVRVARAKGLPESLIFLRHVLRPSLTPLITVFGYGLGGVMSGSVIVEKVLGWPGLGELSVIAVKSRDVPLLMGVVLVTATAVLIANLLADILLRINDPRLR